MEVYFRIEVFGRARIFNEVKSVRNEKSDVLPVVRNLVRSEIVQTDDWIFSYPVIQCVRLRNFSTIFRAPLKILLHPSCLIFFRHTQILKFNKPKAVFTVLFPPCFVKDLEYISPLCSAVFASPDENNPRKSVPVYIEYQYHKNFWQYTKYSQKFVVSSDEKISSQSEYVEISEVASKSQPLKLILKKQRRSRASAFFKYEYNQ